MRMNGMSRGLVLAAAFFCASVPASATTLTIVNPSFEEPATDTLQSDAAHWYPIGANSASGVWNIKKFPAGFWVASILDSQGNQVSQVAYLASPLGSGDGGLAQVLDCPDCKFASNLEYTLTGLGGVPVKEGPPNANPPTYEISLWAGSQRLGLVSFSGPQRTLEPFTLTVPVDESAFSAVDGQWLRIELLSYGGESAVDDLFLSATAVPEPASVALVALGMSLLAIRLRGRDRRQIHWGAARQRARPLGQAACPPR